jgi:hypothetical protein
MIIVLKKCASVTIVVVYTTINAEGQKIDQNEDASKNVLQDSG